MNLRKVSLRTGLTSIIIGAALFASSCTPMVTQEQLAELKQLRNKERTLREDIKEKKKEKTRLEAEVQARNKELQKCKDDTEFVKSKLSAWPNVWPDWKPAPPPPPEESK